MYGSDWVMRLYYDIDPKSESMKHVCNIACFKSNLELCDINSNNEIFDLKKFNIKKKSLIYPLLWRQLAILDLDVDILLIRDLDSYISKREVDAVTEFENSEKVFYAFKRVVQDYS